MTQANEQALREALDRKLRKVLCKLNGVQISHLTINSIVLAIRIELEKEAVLAASEPVQHQHAFEGYHGDGSPCYDDFCTERVSTVPFVDPPKAAASEPRSDNESACPRCEGTGVYARMPADPPRPCAICNGTGKITPAIADEAKPRQAGKFDAPLRDLVIYIHQSLTGSSKDAACVFADGYTHIQAAIMRYAAGRAASGSQQVAGEDAWLDEFVTAAISGTNPQAENGLLRNCLRTCLRAFAANLKRQIAAALAPAQLSVTPTQLLEISKQVPRGLTDWTYWFDFVEKLNALLRSEAKEAK